MAPSQSNQPLSTDKPLYATINTLYNLQLISTSPSLQSSSLTTELNTLHTHLAALHAAASSASSTSLFMPPEIVEYVQEGRNPDIYTREFAELTQRNNQKLKGKMEAFARFAIVLGREVRGAVPEMADVVEDVLKRTNVRGRGFEDDDQDQQQQQQWGQKGGDAKGIVVKDDVEVKREDSDVNMMG